MLSQEAIGLVIVHGIGDPAPGEVLRDVTDALIDAKLATFDSVEQQIRFKDPCRSKGSRTSFFPAHFRTGRTLPRHSGDSKTEIIAAEVFWGSASQLAPGQWGILQGLASLLLNVPALVVGADDRRPGLPGFLHRTAWFASMLLAGPVLAFNIVLLLALAFYTVFHSALGAPGRTGELVIIEFTIAASIGLTELDWLWFPEAQWSLRLAGVVALAGTFWTGVGLRGFALAATWILLLASQAVAVLVLFLGISFGVAWTARTLTRSCWTVMLVVSLQFGLWALIIPLLSQMLERAIRQINARPIDELHGLSTAADGLQWTAVGVVLAAVSIVVCVRWAKAWWETRCVARGRRTHESARPSGRLIVHPLIGWTLIVAALVGAGVMLMTTLTDWLPPGILRAINIGAAVDIAGIAILLLPLAKEELRLGLDLAHDVIFYVYYRFYRCEHGRKLMQRGRKGDAQKPNPMGVRFAAVVRHLLDDLAVRQLVIVAHSQGSIIAVDELKEFERPLPPVSLVTCGSPVTELYQYYFPTVYPPWHPEGYWTPLFQRIGRWGNFYRLDDYVGTRIVPPHGLCEFRQHSIGPGGHTNYWRDPRFMAALDAWGLFDLPVRRPSPAGVKVDRPRPNAPSDPGRHAEIAGDRPAVGGDIRHQ